MESLMPQRRLAILMVPLVLLGVAVAAALSSQGEQELGLVGLDRLRHIHLCMLETRPGATAPTSSSRGSGELAPLDYVPRHPTAPERAEVSGSTISGPGRCSAAAASSPRGLQRCRFRRTGGLAGDMPQSREQWPQAANRRSSLSN